MSKKIFIHVDMNAFFASIEQRDYPKLLGKPIAVTNGKYGSCIITSSYEARAFGIKTGMKISEGRKICPYLIQRSSRPTVYAATSARIMNILHNITPDIQIYSVDEAFLELTNCMKIYKEINYVAYKIKDLIYESENLKCSIGISFSKSLAKYASKINKPDGITYINRNNYHEYLDNSPIETLCGVSTGVKSFLNHHGVYKCSDMKKLPISILSNRFGNIGKKIWLMANGNDFEGLIPDLNHPKSLGHGKVLKPNTKSSYLIKKVFLRMSNKLAIRLRKSNFESNVFLIGIKIKAGWIQKKVKIEKATCNRNDIFNICLSYLNLFEKNTGIYQVQVTALNPLKKNTQMDIFSEDNDKSEVLDQALEDIYDKFGPETIKPARLISDHTDSPDVIAPAWRPSGHRKSV